jgi:pimeloyl-ACP methyl ester carboxylesterase
MSNIETISVETFSYSYADTNIKRMNLAAKSLVTTVLLLIVFGTTYTVVFAGVDGRVSKRESALNVKFSDDSLSDAQRDALLTKVEKLQKNARSKSVEDKIAKIKNKKKPSSSKQADAAVTQDEIKTINDEIKANWDTQVSSLTADEQRSLAYVEPDYIFALDAASYTPNDADFVNQWTVKSVLAQNSALFSTVATLNRPVIAAMIDAGVDYGHEDLSANMWKSDRCVDEGGQKLASVCTNGYDFVQNVYDPYPVDGVVHGTAVASLIGASTDNAKGIASFSQNRVKIMSLRVADGNTADLNAVTRAVRFAVNNGADVINMSLGTTMDSMALKDAISYATQRGITIVASAGNSSSNLDVYPQYPASYPLANIITVAAVDKTGARPSWSNYGSAVDVSAPGTAIKVASIGNTYATMSGTSFSTPIVTSLVARALSEGKSPTSFIPTSKILGTPVAAVDGTDFASPYISLPDGRLLNIFAKGGQIIDSAAVLDWSAANQRVGGSTLGFPTQITPNCALATGNTTLPSSIPSIGTGAMSVNFSWAGVTGATQYGLYVTQYQGSTNGTGASVFSSESFGSAARSQSITVQPGTYYWNTAAGSGSIATIYSLTPACFFKIDSPVALPATPSAFGSTVSSAAYGPIVSGTSNTVSWTSSASSFNVALVNLAGGQQTFTGVGNPFTFTGLIPGAKYAMNVSACNTAGCSTASAAHYFQMAQTIPAVPGGITPLNATFPGGLAPSTGHAVSWGAVSNANQYSVAWTERDANNVQVGGVNEQFVNAPTTSYTIPVSAGKKYRFDVGACNTAGCSARSSNSYFYTAVAQAAVPSVPTITLSAAGTVNTAYSIKVKSTDTDSTNLTYQIAWQTSAAATPVADVTVVGTQGVDTTVSKTYTTAGTYCIRAQATDGTNVSGWSPCSNVTINAAIVLPDLVPEYISLNKSSAQPGEQVVVTFKVKNSGQLAVATPFKVGFYLNQGSTNAPNTNNFVGELTITDPIGTGVSLQKTYTLTLPASNSLVYAGTGSYALTMYPDSANAIAESQENNLNGLGGAGYASISVIGAVSGAQSITVVPASSVQVVNTAFNTTFTGTGIPVTSRLQLSASAGTIDPQYIDLVAGVKTVPIKLSSPGPVSITATLAGSSVKGISQPITVQDNPAAPYLAQWGNIAVQVVDTANIPVQGAIVEFTCLEVTPGCSAYSATTGADGIARLVGTSLPSVNQLRYKITYTNSSGEVLEYYGGTVAVNVFGLMLNKSIGTVTATINTSITPVILIPGIMGSTLKSATKNQFAPEVPGYSQPDQSLLRLHDPIGKLNVVGWENIEQLLVSQNYKVGKTIIECPYDFRMPDLEAARVYLASCIDTAIALNPGFSKVDIIAHSQGGLLTRALIQQPGSTYASKIRKIAFVGTPHLGSSEAYAPWEGGRLDISQLPGGSVRRDSVVSNYKAVYKKDIQMVCGKNFYKLKSDETFNLPGPCSNPSALVDPLSDYVPNPLEVKKYLEENSPSVKQLLPVYSFLFRSNGTVNAITDGENVNEFLRALNRIENGTCADGICDDNTAGKLMSLRPANSPYNFADFQTVMNANGIQVQVFYDGEGSRLASNLFGLLGLEDTLHNIDVAPGPMSGAPTLYKDGVPKSLKKNSLGDGTVPAISASLENIVPLTVSKNKSGSHPTP